MSLTPLIMKEWSPANFSQRQWQAFRYNPTTLTFLPDTENPLAPPVTFVSLFGWTHEPLRSPTVVNFIAFDFDNPVLEYAQSDTLNFLRLLAEIYDVNLDEVGLYFSGAKGFHVVLPTELFVGTPEIINVPPAVIRGVAMDLAQGFASFDQSIYDVRRLFRVPGAQNMHSGLYKIPLRYGDLVSLTAADIRAMAVVQQPLIPFGVDEAITKNEHLSELLLRHVSLAVETSQPVHRRTTPFPELFMPAKPGTRNNAAIQLTGMLLGHIRDQQVLQQVVHMWNRTNPVPLPTRELTALVSGAFTRYTRQNHQPIHPQRRSA